MKKLLFIMATFCLFLTSAKAELGVNVGASLQVGSAEASGSENENGVISKSNKEEMLFGTGSFFVEKTLDFLPGPLSRLSIGYDYVPHEIGTGTATNIRLNENSGGSISNVSAKENNVSAEFEDLNTIYITANITDFLYIKAGLVSVDAITTENLATGSTYGNASLEGEVYGFGLKTSTDSGLFLRAEANWMDIDGATLTSQTNSANKVTLDGIDTVSGRISIGKSF
jgi:hypothetical protein